MSETRRVKWDLVAATVTLIVASVGYFLCERDIDGTEAFFLALASVGTMITKALNPKDPTYGVNSDPIV